METQQERREFLITSLLQENPQFQDIKVPEDAGEQRQLLRALLASCYRSCLELAAENSLESVAFCCISTGGFYPYDTLEEYWAFWSRYIWINRYAPAPKPVYDELLALVKEKDYFVLIAANP